MVDERTRPSPERHIIIYEETEVVIIRRRPEQDKKSVEEVGCLGNAFLLALKAVLVVLFFFIFTVVCSYFTKVR